MLGLRFGLEAKTVSLGLVLEARGLGLAVRVLGLKGLA